MPSMGELSAVAAHSWLDGLKTQGACRYAHRKKGICRNTMPSMGELSAVAAYSWQDGLKAQRACRYAHRKKGICTAACHVRVWQLLLRHMTEGGLHGEPP